MPAIISLAVVVVPPEERGAVVGTAAVFLDVAFGVAPVVLGVLAASMGASLTFLVSAVIAALGCAALLVAPAVKSRCHRRPLTDAVGCGAMTIERVFVAGAGLMGHGIAQVHAAIG